MTLLLLLHRLCVCVCVDAVQKKNMSFSYFPNIKRRSVRKKNFLLLFDCVCIVGQPNTVPLSTYISQHPYCDSSAIIQSNISTSHQSLYTTTFFYLFFCVCVCVGGGYHRSSLVGISIDIQVPHLRCTTTVSK
jgi:hypothetical protein